jgi:hypothetical protein
MSKVIKSKKITLGDEHFLEFWKHDEDGFEEALVNDVQLCWVRTRDKKHFTEDLERTIERYSVKL